MSPTTINVMKFRRLLSVFKNRFLRTSKPSLNDLDTKLQKYLCFDGGFFIEAGANDGYSQSNTYYLEKKRGWRGLLVEGIPELANRCARDRKKSRVVNCALVADETEDTVTMRFAHLMSLVEGAMKSKAGDDDHISSGLEVQHLSDSYSVEVSARTLESILDEDPPGKIDFFSLDVEGFELEVLKGLNLERYRPHYILVEARYYDEVNSYLTGFGYEMTERMSNLDHLYVDAMGDDADYDIT